MKRAIIVGASSGIGRELAKVLSQDGYTLGLTGRRLELLSSLREEVPTASVIRQMDVSHTAQAMQQLEELIQEIGGVDLLIISAGIGFINPELEWEKEESTLGTNVSGFAAIANVALKHFIGQSSGHLVGISSIAALRGSGAAPAYNASKAFVSNYMEGLRQKVSKLKLPIIITDIKPGFVDTAMAKGEGLFWLAPPEKAARQIYDAIKKRKSGATITKRWRVIAWLFKVLPDRIYNKI
ncbi:MAG TPA: SDR family NAD(P)-dependent oxidoreductase [Chthoniobacterales bacterium]|jgi:short-subunit dehydrogenase